MIFWLFLPAAHATTVAECGIQYPIAGSAGFTNAQAGRRTNRNTYSAAAFAEQAMTDGSPEGLFALQWNATFNAASVPTLCGDGTLPGDDRRQHIYNEPLDLYASNLLFAFDTKSFGAFYSASVTQSIMGMRVAAVPALIIQMYPLVSAPVVGIWQRGDGVSSYSLDWIGGAHVDTKWFGARVGYAGIGGLYSSFDERTVGLFGTVDVPLDRSIVENPWNFLRTGLDRLDPSQFGAADVGKIIGMTSIFFRDLPFGEEAVTDDTSDTSGDTTAVASLPEGSTATRSLTDARLKTFHFEQKNIGQIVDVDLSYAISPKPQIFNGLLGIHSPGYQLGHDAEVGAELEPGAMVKIGIVRLPAQYALGLEGGTYFAARAELRLDETTTFLLLFNDPEQLALYPYATNALTVNATVNLGMQ